MLKVGTSVLSRLVSAGPCPTPSLHPATTSSARYVRTIPAIPSARLQPQVQAILPDQLFRRIELEYRGHDKEVLKSYTKFLTSVCDHLGIQRGKIVVHPYIRWVQYALRSKFVHKKYKLHYETRTHITNFEVFNLTGSSASTFLEYIERNVPEGVGLKIEYDELQPLPLTIRPKPIKENMKEESENRPGKEYTEQTQASST